MLRRTKLIMVLMLLSVILLLQACSDSQMCQEVFLFFFDCDTESDIDGLAVISSDVGPGKEGSAALTVLEKFQIEHVVHKASRSCDTCHTRVTSFKSQVFKKPMPQMCYDCHDSYDMPGVFVHGPVAVGACIVCHEPHQSNYVHLQKLAQPQLCVQCHDIKDYFQVSDSHPDASDKLCTECHDPHAGKNPMLLKE